MVRIRVLGDLTLEVDGRVLDRLRSHRARGLLGWLAVHPGLHPRARVASVFWPDVLDASARESLRTALATLRRELGEPGAGLITATRDRVGIEPSDDVWVDLHAFDTLVRAGSLDDAAALGDGELLRDLDDDWVGEARELHARAMLAVLTRVADDVERAGDLDAALSLTRRQLALSPLSEHAQRALIRRLAAAGDRAGALRASRDYAERLRRELGIAPSAETRELVHRIRMTTSGAAAPGETSTVATPDRESVTPAGLDVRTRYARNDAANIAYQTTGEGRRDLVIVPGFVSHVEHCWTHPPYARFIRRLASVARVTVFDKRGSGLSDPLVGEPSLEERTDDVSAVMDAAGLGHATVMGISDGAAVAALFAAMNPERVDGLIVYGGFERALSAPDYPWAVTAEELSLLLEAIVGSWGEGVSLGYLASEHANDEVLRQWWAGFERLAASPGQARAALGLYGAIDLREVLPSVQAPTLVIHRTEDILPVEGARRFATRIPGARFVELPGDDHWPWIGDADDLLPELERFLAAEPRAHEPDRVLATVLFADLSSSVLHEQLVRQELGSHRGRVLALDDRGVLASFDRPARGIRCACAIRDAARDAGVHVRAGLHAGECERLGDGLDGHAVRIGTSIGRLADPGEVLVSSTVKDLVAGSPLAFEDRGAHVFDGALGEWRLYAVAGAGR